jgi:hypothetical protein
MLAAAPSSISLTAINALEMIVTSSSSGGLGVGRRVDPAALALIVGNIVMAFSLVSDFNADCFVDVGFFGDDFAFVDFVAALAAVFLSGDFFVAILFSPLIILHNGVNHN